MPRRRRTNTEAPNAADTQETPTASDATEAGRVEWTEEMEEALLNAFLEQYRLGKRGDSGWRGEVWERVQDRVQTAWEACGGSGSLTKTHCQSKEMVIKGHFKDHMYLETLSGFNFDHGTGKWVASEQAWEDLKRTRKSCLWNRDNVLGHLDVLNEIYRPSMATGEDAFSLQRNAENTNSATTDSVTGFDPDANLRSPATPLTEPSSAPNSILQEVQRKRLARSKPWTPTNQVESADADDRLTLELANLASARIEAARLYSAPMQAVGSALDILYSAYSEGPKKLTSEDMLKATKLLSNSAKAEVFLAMSRNLAASQNPRMESIRDAWLVEEAGVFICLPFDHDL